MRPALTRFGREALLLAACIVVMCIQAHAQGSLAYVTNTGTDNTVSVYTTNADGTLTSGGTIGVGLNPVYMTVRSDQAFAYVANSNSRTISVIDTATQTVGNTVTVAAASDLLGIVLTPDGSKAFVSARASLTQTVRVYDVDSLTGQLTPTDTINVLQGPRGLAMSPDGSKLFVVNQSAQSVQIIGVATSTVLGATSVGNQPIDIALNASGTRAYVSNFSGASVSVIDTSNATVVATFPTGVGGVYGIALTPDGNYYYVSTRSDSKVHAFNASSGTEIGSGFATGNIQGDLMISPDGLSLYVANGGPDNVSMFTIDPSTGSLTPKVPATIASGEDPTGAAICRYGNSMLATGRIFVANTSGALNCLGPTPTFSGGTLLLRGAPFSTTKSFELATGGGTIDSNGNDATFSGVFSGANALTKTGSGVVTFSGSNTNTGTTTVNGGTLKAGAANSLSSSSAVSIGASGTLDLNNFAQTITSLSGLGTVTLGSATLTTSSSGSTTFSGVMGGSGGVTKTGTGTLTLAGVNTYTGATTVSSGTLLVNGSLAAGSAVTVAGGATLGGSGTINGNVTFLPGSFLLPGLIINGTITPAASSTSVLPSSPAVTYGTSQTFTATVTSGGTAVTTGTVTFTDITTAATLAGNVALNGSGQASTSAILGAGSHSIQATYNPDPVHAGSSNTTNVTVNRAVLTVTADNKTITYAASPAFTATITGFVNGESVAVVSGTPGFTTNATTTNGAPNSGTWTITPAVGTLSSANYSFSFATGTLTVNKATLTITADPLTITYGTAPTFTATPTGFLNSDTAAVVSGSASFTTNATTTNGLPNAGSWTITPAAGTLSATNYNFSFATGTLTVNRATLTVTADAKTITYPAAAPPFTAAITGFVNSDPPTVVTGAAGFTTNATTTNGVPNAGIWTITPAVGTLSAANYSFSFATATLTVNKATLTITADPQTITYGAAPTFTATPTGFLNSDTAAVVTGAASFTTNATLTNGNPNAGSWTIIPAAGTLAAANYTFTFANGALTVNRAVLTVTANSAVKVQGAANPALGATITGFVNGDTTAVVTGSASLTTTATVSSPPGTYPITAAAGTLAAANYTFAFVNGTLTVNPPEPNPVPAITSVAPAFLLATGQPANLLVRGTDFAPFSLVQVNGTNRPATFRNSSELAVALSAADLAVPGTLSVTVFTPEPGGGASNIRVTVLNPADVFQFAVGPGVSVVETAGTSATLVSGFAEILPQSGAAAPPSFARWSYSNNGVVVSEATVPAGRPFQAGRIFALVGELARSGVAIANPNLAPVTISFFFTDQAGRDFGHGVFTIPANGQLARFLNEGPYNAPAGTEGTLSFSATLPVSVVALRGASNLRGDFLATTLPVSDLFVPASMSAVTVPHFTAGAGWSTSVHLVNSTNSPLNGTIQFIDPASGQAIAINVNGTSATSFDYAVPARSARRLSTSGSSGTLTTGSIRIVPSTANATPSAFAVFSLQSGGNIVSESGMAGSSASASMLAFVESAGNFSGSAPGSAESGIAIANAGSSAASVNLEFTVLNGSPSTVRSSLSLPAQGQTSIFLSQIPGFQNLPTPLKGILRVSSAAGTGNLVMSVIRGRYNERGDFLFSSTPLIPASPAPVDAELIIPHIIASGGYTTSFVFMNNSPDTINILLRSTSPSGQPLNLTFK